MVMSVLGWAGPKTPIHAREGVLEYFFGLCWLAVGIVKVRQLLFFDEGVRKISAENLPPLEHLKIHGQCFGMLALLVVDLGQGAHGAQGVRVVRAEDPGVSFEHRDEECLGFGISSLQHVDFSQAIHGAQHVGVVRPEDRACSFQADGTASFSASG